MRKSLFVVSLMFAVVIWGMLLAGSSGPSATVVAQPTETEVPPTSAPPVIASLERPLCAEDLGGLEVFSEPLASKAFCCQDQCARDRDCDRFCGAKGAGDCVRVNSCCNECACLF